MAVSVISVAESLGAEMVIVTADAEAGSSAKTRDNLLIVTNLFIVVPNVS